MGDVARARALVLPGLLPDMLAAPEQRYVIASTAGYGFISSLQDMISRNKAGKALLTLSAGAHVMLPVTLSGEGLKLLTISNEGRMLIFPADQLPVLSKGKGNRLQNIPTPAFEAKEQWLAHIVVLSEQDTVTLWAGKRKLTLKPSDLEHYFGERGRRGLKLPRGLQKVDQVELEPAI